MWTQLCKLLGYCDMWIPMVLCWSAYFLALQFWCHLLLSFFCGISVPFLRSHHLSLFPQSNFQILYMVFCKNIGVHRWPNKTKSSWRMGVLYGCADQTTKSMFANNCSCPGHATWIKMGKPDPSFPELDTYWIQWTESLNKPELTYC